jgi:hypothetical protein
MHESYYKKTNAPGANASAAEATFASDPGAFLMAARTGTSSRTVLAVPRR